MTTTHAEPPTSFAGLDVGADPWIPVTMVDGARADFGLRDLLINAHRIESLVVGAPPVECVLLRILYALGLRVSGFEEIDGVARYDLLEQGGFDVSEVEAYFARYAGRFGLFDPVRPWMQEPRLPSQMDIVVEEERRAGQVERKSSGVGKLAVTRASASSSAWFGAFHDGAPVPGVEAAGHLLTWLWYGQGGPQGSMRRTPGHTGRHASVGPLRGFVSYHPTGRTLFETIVLGVPDTELVDRERDVAPWEADELPDPDGELPMPAGPVSLLTARAQHALLLVPSVDRSAAEDVYIAWAWPSTLPPAMDPYLNWLEGKKGQQYPQRADVGRSLFRDVDGLLLHRKPGSKERRPLVMDAIHDVPAEVLDHVGVAAYGFEQGREKSGGEKGWYRAVTPAVLRLIRVEEAANAGRLAVARERAELCASRLVWAVDEVWKETAVPPGDPDKKEYASRSPLGEQALAAYWPLAEAEFWLLVEQRAWDRAVAVFGQLAVSLYDGLMREITDAQQPRTVRAVVRHRGKVASTLPKHSEAKTRDGEVA
ncbi:type I-E CRISPR-associated protein Cse1/CasA [Streptomyces sp. VTCC 41912]|uniref:type I-E CRISPR-associated protein Cse1/CasA n=1 Tax=Streptomyces sp. VTCC 41912 TaxID=3383243 RepID=UPI003896CB87